MFSIAGKIKEMQNRCTSIYWKFVHDVTDASELPIQDAVISLLDAICFLDDNGKDGIHR